MRLLLVQQGCCLPADLEAVSGTRAATRAAATNVARGDELHPQRTVALVVRGGAGLAKCIEAALLRTRRCGGESRQIEDHPRTGLQFLHVDVQGGPFGGHLVLAARSYVGFPVGGELLAIAAENDWRPCRSGGTSDSTTTWGDSKGHRCSSRCAATTSARTAGSCGTTATSAAAESTESNGAAAA